MDKREIVNAKITNTKFGTQDHGIMTCMIYLEFKGGGQGFGGYSLDEPLKDAAGNFICRQGAAEGMEFIMRTLKAVGAENWEDLRGKHCRIEHSWTKVYHIGHIIRDEWFDPTEIGFK